MNCRAPLSAAILLLLSAFSIASAQPPQLETRDVVTELATPWEILWGPDDWIWMTERRGFISRVNPETGVRHVLTRVADNFEHTEAGLMGMALHPNFPEVPYLYVSYVYMTPTGLLGRVARFRYLLNTTTGFDTLIEPIAILDSIPSAPSHAGSRLVAMRDGTLFITLGERADYYDDAQDQTKINGKILRINLDGTCPADNPWVSDPWPSRLVWSKGHRNPQGLVMASNGILYSSEHGPSTDDEINIIEPQRNYGWVHVIGMCDNKPNPYESVFCKDSNVFEPIRTWTPTIAPAGVDYYDKFEIAEWRNALLLASLKTGLHVLRMSADGRSVLGDTTLFTDSSGTSRYGRVRDLCISPDGRVFIATSNKDGRGMPRAGDDRIIEIKAPQKVIKMGSVAGTAFCTGALIDIPFGLTMAFNQDNVFTAQISDAVGSFALPHAIGRWPGTNGGTFQGKIPSDISPGSGYRIRVVSSSPATVGEVNDRDITIEGLTISIAETGPIMMCSGDTVELTATEGFSSYQWSNGATSRQIAVGDSGSYTVTVSDPNGCSTTSLPVVVQRFPLVRPVISWNGAVLIVTPEYRSYLWKLNGAPIAQGSEPSYRPAATGSYVVVVTDSLGCEEATPAFDVKSIGIETQSETKGFEFSLDLGSSRLEVMTDLARPSIVEITLSNMNGVEVLKVEERGEGIYRRTISLVDVPTGAYILQLRAGERVWREKLICR